MSTRTHSRVSARTVEVGALARLEGGGALHVKVHNGAVTEVELRSYEPPRFFEGLLCGRTCFEAPEMAARICGICPVAYQMTASQAIEQALGLEVSAQVRALRRLLCCGEWIGSHALHIYLLHAPDFLGYESAIHMARDHPAAVQRGLQLKQAGNDLVALVGGRAIQPVNLRVGGFYRAPERRDLEGITDRLKRARDVALETVQWVAGFPFPELEQDYEFVALRDGDNYPLEAGRIVSSRGLDIDAAEFPEHFVEDHVPRSTALHWLLRARGAYHVGPLARFSLNFDRLSPLSREAARDAGLPPVCRNPFRSIVVRAVETVYACDEALRLIAGYHPPEPAAGAVELRAGVGHACSEAPRGILYHRFALDQAGTVLEARIVPPTAQNQRTIEADLGRFVAQNLHLSDDKLGWRCEQVVRNYDPCISCATHFLRLAMERS